MLQDLTQPQLEQALAWLANPVLSPPQELRALTEVEWFLLDRLLENLLEEKQQHPVQ